MSESRREAKVYIVEYICDSCGIGKMKSTGVANLTAPPSYPHKYNDCGYIKTFSKKYPCTVTEVIEC